MFELGCSSSGVVVHGWAWFSHKVRLTVCTASWSSSLQNIPNHASKTQLHSNILDTFPSFLPPHKNSNALCLVI